MIVLDTNVLSELMRPRPNPQVLAWVDGLDPGLVAITAMNEAEILHGIRRLPDGRRKAALQQCWDELVADIFAGRVWPFSSEAAHWYADLLRTRERLARPMATADAVIAATALAHGAQLATGDVADFADVGLDLINPWASSDNAPVETPPACSAPNTRSDVPG
ncbi:type II toxin-antitoxin system VapC family toxin [Cyanobium sp. Alchichica 3B3-8F6]|nr:type II toxin-antitoxin system VapC family toxin [Cyanobium sp. Alchichica 3B3-8F6]